MKSILDIAACRSFFLSVYGEDEVIASIFDRGAANYIVKPFSPMELATRIRAAQRGRLPPALVDLLRRSPPWPGTASCFPAPTATNDNCPLRHSPADCYIVRIRRLRKGIPSSTRRRNLASLSHPQPPHAPGRSVRQRTSTRQLTVADMPENEYDDSNAAARPLSRPFGVCNPLTHVTKVPTSVARPTPTRSDPGRSQGTPPEPVPVPATQSRRWRHRPWFLPQPPSFPRRRSGPFSLEGRRLG